jgi:hypothetical protein
VFEVKHSFAPAPCPYQRRARTSGKTGPPLSPPQPAGFFEWPCKFSRAPSQTHKLQAKFSRGDKGKAAVLRSILLLSAVILGSSQLQSQNRPALSPIAVPQGHLSLKPLVLPVQEPYCELGYGACGGQCNEAGKKPWDCPAEALPCHQRGQHCTCEEAALCKPKRKRSELSPPATSRPAARGANQATPQAGQPSNTPGTDQWRRVLSRLGL